MKRKFTILVLLFTCFGFALNAQTPDALLDDLIDIQFTNDLPVIQDLGLRVELYDKGKPVPQIEVEMVDIPAWDVLGLGPDKYTHVWGYQFPGLPASYPGATIVARKNKPVNIKWTNNLPAHFLPIDASLHMAHPDNIHGAPAVAEWYANGNVPAVAHLHGGHTESASDGLPEQWYTQGVQDWGSTFVKTDFTYHNDQEAATLWYHDHALGITRLNVYAGLAGFYLLRDDNEEKLIETNTIPGGDYEIEIVIQDRMFDANGQLFWPAYPGSDAYFEFITDMGVTLGPPDFPGGGPSALAEFFGDVIIVNGKAWPRLEVEPRKYRFRLLNGSDSRFYILKLDSGAPLMVIGTDDGLLPKPVNVNELVFAPGERYDVVVDFSGNNMGDNITMLNVGPDSPFGDLPVDEPADPETTGQIMQFQVNKQLSDIPDAKVMENTPLRKPIKKLQANAPSRQLVLFEGMDELGRLQPMLGTMEDGSLTWFEDNTENPDFNAVEEWEVYNATGDAHPIHLHLVAFQIKNRESFDGWVEERPQIQHSSTVGDFSTYGTGGVLHVTSLAGDVTPPLPHERGWKDTFIVPPGQVGRLVAHFDREGRYVWHCHILSHEDHEMMRPFEVGPRSHGGKKGAVVDQPDLDFEFRIFPNPASVRTTVEFVLASDADVRVSIYGMDGRLMNTEELGRLSEGVQAISVPLGHLDNGMYIFELKAGDQQYRESIMISK